MVVLPFCLQGLGIGSWVLGTGCDDSFSLGGEDYPIITAKATVFFYSWCMVLFFAESSNGR